MEFIYGELEQLRHKRRYRALTPVGSLRGTQISIGRDKLVNFASNDYLGLARHPLVRLRTAWVAWSQGNGAGSSRLLSGNRSVHENLEDAIARYKLAEAAIVYPTGYMANIGAICALLDGGGRDLVLLDRLNHASIIDAARMSRARVWLYPHGDTRRLSELLQLAARRGFRRRLVVTESLFSMDGDLAPLPEIARLCKFHGAMLMLDEAHATGVLGRSGRGALEQYHMNPNETDIIMGTLSKAVGASGGFVAGRRDLIAYLRNKSRSFMYTTALPPAVCAGADTALGILLASNRLVRRLGDRVRYFVRGLTALGLPVACAESPIVSIPIGDDSDALRAAAFLKTRGMYCPAIRPPTVPEGTARLRLSVTALHDCRQLDAALEGLKMLKATIKMKIPRQ